MKKFNKALSAMLSLVLCLSMVTPALAASFQDLQAAIDSEETSGESNGVAWNTTDDQRNITLNETVTQGEGDLDKITVSGNVTLDLNGNKVEGSYDHTDEDPAYLHGMIEVNSGVSLTVKDGIGEGEIRNSNGDGNTVLVKGEMTLESGTIAANDSTQKSVLVMGGEFTMTGGTLDGGSESTVGVMNGTVNLEGGKVTNENTTAAWSQGGTINVSGDAQITSEKGNGVHVNQGGTANISGGTITGGGAGVSGTNSSTLNLTGGKIHSTAGPKESHADIELSNAAGTNAVTISGGVDFEYLGIQGDGDEAADVKNVITVETDEGTYTITYTKNADGDRVVTIGSDGLKVDKLYDVVKKMVIKDNEKKDGADASWKWIFLGPDAIESPTNPIPPTGVKYAYVSGTKGRDLPDSITQPTEKVEDPASVKVEGGTWVFKGWQENPFDGLTDVDNNPANSETVSMFDQDGVHIDELIIKGTWVFVADPPIIVDPVEDEVEIDDVDVPLAGLFTRADAVGYLWEQSGSPEWELSDFDDVPEDHQWAVAIGWAQDMGIAVADLDGNFRPDDLVLRSVEDIELSPEGELQEFLNRYAVYAGIELEPGELFIELDGAWDDIIMGEEAQVIFDNFFAKLELALTQAA